jgi:hypothetical protein
MKIAISGKIERFLKYLCLIRSSSCYSLRIPNINSSDHNRVGAMRSNRKKKEILDCSTVKLQML